MGVYIECRESVIYLLPVPRRGPERVAGVSAPDHDDDGDGCGCGDGKWSQKTTVSLG